MTRVTRDTTTGIRFEEKVSMKQSGIDLSKHNLYKYLTKIGKDWKEVISKKLLPDEAYFDEEERILYVYEKKFQQTSGSADEKPQTCAFKISQFRKLGDLLGAREVFYTYIFNDWFKKSEYRDMLEYIKSVDGCDYFFYE